MFKFFLHNIVQLEHLLGVFITNLETFVSVSLVQVNCVWNVEKCPCVKIFIQLYQTKILKMFRAIPWKKKS